MTILAKTTAPTPPKNPIVFYSSSMYGGIVVVMVTAQLFKFEEFVPLLTSFGLGGGEAPAKILASCIVIAEVFAVPFLLRMHLSSLMRYVSMAAGWLVAAVWLYVMVRVNSSVNVVEDAGFLGTAITVPMGWWCVVIALGFGVLAGVASWGMWPKWRESHGGAKS